MCIICPLNEIKARRRKGSLYPGGLTLRERVEHTLSSVGSQYSLSGTLHYLGRPGRLIRFHCLWKSAVPGRVHGLPHLHKRSGSTCAEPRSARSPGRAIFPLRQGLSLVGIAIRQSTSGPAPASAEDCVWMKRNLELAGRPGSLVGGLLVPPLGDRYWATIGYLSRGGAYVSKLGCEGR